MRSGGVGKDGDYVMLVHLDKVHKPVHNTLPVARPPVLEVDQRGVNIFTSGSDNQTLSKINSNIKIQIKTLWVFLGNRYAMQCIESIY